MGLWSGFTIESLKQSCKDLKDKCNPVTKFLIDKIVFIKSDDGSKDSYKLYSTNLFAPSESTQLGSMGLNCPKFAPESIITDNSIFPFESQSEIDNNQVNPRHERIRYQGSVFDRNNNLLFVSISKQEYQTQVVYKTKVTCNESISWWNNWHVVNYYYPKDDSIHHLFEFDSEIYGASLNQSIIYR